MAEKPTTTSRTLSGTGIGRRTLIGAALALPAAPALANALGRESEWHALERRAAAFHRDGAAVVQKARAAGLDIDACSGLYRARDAQGRKQFILVFGDWDRGVPVAQVSMAGIMHDYAL